MELANTHMQVEEQKKKSRRVLVGSCLAHFTHDGLSDMLYIFLPIWQQAFGLNYAQVGFLRTAFSGALALFQMPAGLLAGAIGTLPVLVCGTVLLGTSLISISMLSETVLLAALLVAGGMGAGTQHPLASSAIAHVYRGNASRIALSAYNFSGDVGKTILPWVASVLIVHAGWQGAISMLGLFGLTSGILIYWVLRNIPLQRQKASDDKRRIGIGFLSRKNASPFVALSCIGMIDNATRGGFLTLLPFVLQNKGADMVTTAAALGLIFAGGAFGRLFCGILATHAGVLRSVIVTEILTAACIISIVFLSVESALVVSPILGVALNGTSSILYGSIPELVESGQRSEAFAFFYTITIGAGALSPFVYGIASDTIGIASTIFIIAGLVLITIPLTNPLKGKLGCVQ